MTKYYDCHTFYLLLSFGSAIIGASRDFETCDGDVIADPEFVGTIYGTPPVEHKHAELVNLNS